MTDYNFRVEVTQHCAGCTCQPPKRPETEDIVRAMTESLDRDEHPHPFTD